MIAGIELGGTKTVVAIGDCSAGVTEEFRFPTTTPKETFGRAHDWLRDHGTPQAIGVASFGPVGVIPGRARYGQVLATPKPGWSGFSITDSLQAAFPSARLSIETDVNAAALAEAREGSARGLEDVAYITIGTGIGAGILTGGCLVHGSVHPEFGHLKVPRHPEDAFPGLCPFHHDCLEGLASGPALAARHGRPADELPPGHPAWEIEAWYLAHGILALLAVTAPARVVVGGGVSQAECFHSRVESILDHLAAGYFPALLEKPFVVAPLLGQQAGIRGALMLAKSALEAS